MNFIVSWIINAVALFVVIHLVGGVNVTSRETIVVAAFVLGLLNTFIRPVIVLLTLPFNILSLGVFTLFINGFLFYLTARFVEGFIVADFWSAFWGALIFGIVSFLLNVLLNTRQGTANFTFRTFRADRRDHEAERPQRYDDAIDVEAHVEEKQKNQPKRLD